MMANRKAFPTSKILISKTIIKLKHGNFGSAIVQKAAAAGSPWYVANALIE